MFVNCLSPFFSCYSPATQPPTYRSSGRSLRKDEHDTGPLQVSSLPILVLFMDAWINKAKPPPKKKSDVKMVEVKEMPLKKNPKQFHNLWNKESNKKDFV